MSLTTPPFQSLEQFMTITSDLYFYYLSWDFVVAEMLRCSTLPLFH